MKNNVISLFNRDLSSFSACCFTSSNLAYLSRARVLASTFKKHNPNVAFILILVDVLPGGYNLSSAEEPFDDVIEIGNIGIPDFISWSFKHNVVELCTAIKASAALYLANLFSKVIYLDPDSAVFFPLDEIVDLLDKKEILLTPHQLSPCSVNDMVLKDIELCTLRHGVFNLGFFAVSARDQGLDFLRWWQSRLMKFCYEDIPSGIFTDQKWCDVVPAYFSGCEIVRDYGCNVASWNLFERRIDFIDGRPVINGEFPLKFYHFTKYGSAGEVMTLRYTQSLPTMEIWAWYGRYLRECEFNPPPAKYWYFGNFSDSTPIDDSVRVEFRGKYFPGCANPYIK
jgi:hypothetical protein